MYILYYKTETQKTRIMTISCLKFALTLLYAPFTYCVFCVSSSPHKKKQNRRPNNNAPYYLEYNKHTHQPKIMIYYPD